MAEASDVRARAPMGPYSAGWDDRELLSLIVHELRSPAAVVAGYLRLLLEHGPEHLTEREREMIDHANHSCHRLLEVVQDLSDLASFDRGEMIASMSPVELFSLCDEVVGTINLELGATRMAFSYSDEDRAAMVDGEAARLKQALHSLITAALREGGSREGCGFVVREPDPHAIVALGPPGIAGRREDILLSRGVPFDRWRGGMGLSLPLAWNIIEAHGGEIWSLTPGFGPACAFSLPVRSV